MVEFVPGRTVEIVDDLVFIDGEEVSAPAGEPIISEGTGGSGDVVIGSTANPAGGESVEDSLTVEETTSEEVAEGDSQATSIFSDIVAESDDLVADDGETIVGGTEDINIGNVGSNEGEDDISGADSSQLDPTTVGDKSGPISTEIQNRKAAMFDFQVSDGSHTSDYFDDGFSNDFDLAGFDFDMEGDDAFI